MSPDSPDTAARTGCCCAGPQCEFTRKTKNVSRNAPSIDQDLVAACKWATSKDADVDAMDLAGRVVLVRCDLNVPLAHSDGAAVIVDDSRARLSLPTIDLLLSKNARVIVASHLGRPKPGKDSPEDMRAAFTLRPVADFFARVRPNSFQGMAEDCVGEQASAVVERVKGGQFALLENTRFHKGEEANDEAFARALIDSTGASVFVLDAFGAAHRAHASVSGVVPHVEKALPGLLMRREIEALTSVMWAPQRPFCCVVGGAKVADKIGVLKALVDIADCILLGGRMAYTFLAAKGIHIGQTAYEVDKVPLAKEIMERAAEQGVTLLLPKDIVVGDTLDNGATTKVVNIRLGCCTPEAPCVAPGLFGGDVGPATAQYYADSLAHCKTIFWNGPMGKYEVPVYSNGTFTVMDAVAEGKGRGTVTIVGGGDSSAAVEASGSVERFSHVSTGGGASLELIEGKKMPGIQALYRAAAGA